MNLHILFEMLGVLSAPYMFTLAKTLPQPHQKFLQVFAVLSILVDGYFFLQWGNKKNAGRFK